MDVREFLVRLLRFVILLLASKAAIAGTTDPSTPDAKYVEFGQQFPNVVRIRTKAPCTNPECGVKEHTQFGSAVIIRPRWILTAAHVVRGATEPVIVREKKADMPLVKVIWPKDFDEKNIGFYDLALGYTAESFDEPFYPELYTDTDELGKAVTFAGYGLYGTFSTGCAKSDERKRAGHNKIDSIERGVLVCGPSVGRERFPLEFMIAPGDSGGGMFIGNKLAGINSFLMARDGKPDGTYGDETAFTRLSLYADWIHEQIKLHELSLQGRATTAGQLP